MLEFKTATDKDINPLNKLINSAYRGDYSKNGWTTEAELLDGLRSDEKEIKDIIETPHQQFELAYEQSNLVGCVLLKKEENVLYFGMFVVEPTLQNKGFGKFILKHIEDLAKKWKMKTIRMTVIDIRDELIGYYERRGYLKTELTEPFPEDTRFGRPKVKGLQFVEMKKELK